MTRTRALAALAIPLALVAFGCQDGEEPGATNVAPTISLFAPSDGSSFPHGQVPTFAGRATDDTDAASALSATWSSDLDGDQGSISLSETGDFSFQGAALSPGLQRVTLTVTDSSGASTARSVNLSIQANAGPEVTIESPASGDVFASDDVVEVEVRVSDDVDGATDLLVDVESSATGVLATGVTPESSGAVTVPVTLAPGQQQLRVVATDTEGVAGQATVSIYVSSDHSDPTCEITSPAVPLVDAGADVLFAGQVDDPDVPEDELVVEWQSSVDGTFATASPDSSGLVGVYHAGLSVGEHVVTLHVIAEEGGTCDASTFLTVYPAHEEPEAAITAPAAGAVAVFGEPILFAATVSDDLDAPEDLAVTWSSDIDGEFHAGAADGAGAISFQYDGLSTGRHLVTLAVTDGGGRLGTATVWIDLFRDDDGDGHFAVPDGGDCDDGSALVHPEATDIPYDGVDQDCDGADDADRDEDGFTGLPVGEDCDDSDPAVHPGAPEEPYDGVDQDCDGADLLDVDGDGWSGAGTDCNDLDPRVHPFAEEIPYDDIDEDCDGFDLVDVDGDGWDGPSGTGPDCDDEDRDTFPGGVDVPYDGVDQDCSGSDVTDIDQDGYVAVEAGGTDCDDGRFGTHPGAVEVAYNGHDDDCSGGDLVDVDGDTWASVLAGGSDCDDDNPDVYPGRGEIPYNGVDDDCASGDLDDVDGDDHVWDGIGGDDCNDNDPFVFFGATETPYNGKDEDCNGADLVDVDGDGYLGTGAGGNDCNDDLNFIHPGATEIPANPYDENCDGVIE